MDRFIVVFSDDAQKSRYPGFTDEYNKPRWGRDFYWCLYETDGEKPIRLVATDGGEPEDQCLTRDWKWVAQELNRQAAYIKKLEDFACDYDEEGVIELGEEFCRAYKQV